MLLKLEGKEYELNCNGRLMLDYQTAFKGANLMVDIYEATKNMDLLKWAKIVYASAQVKESFEEWLGSFKDPFFLLPHINDLTEYFFAASNPTVPVEGKTVKKKTNR